MYGTLGHTMTQSVISLNIGTLNVKNKKKNKNLKIIQINQMTMTS